MQINTALLDAGEGGQGGGSTLNVVIQEPMENNKMLNAGTTLKRIKGGTIRQNGIQ